MSKIRESARGETCSLRIPGVCNSDPATTVFCHLGKKGEATNKRNGDEAMNGVYGCNRCHDAIDFRSRVFLSDSAPIQAELHRARGRFIARAKVETQRKLKERRLMQ